MFWTWNRWKNLQPRISLPPSENQDEFETYNENIKLNLGKLLPKNPFLVAAIWYPMLNQTNAFVTTKKSFEGDAIENLTSQFGLH